MRCVRALRLGLFVPLLALAGCEPMVGGGGGGSVACPGGTDPLFVDQWHLENTGQTNLNGAVAATPGVDLGVNGAWSAGYRGGGVVIAVLDDAVDIGHEDLQANILSGRSVDYTEDPEGDDPSPGIDSGLFHGTAVAGISAARDENGCGGRGAAPRAGVAGFNILSSQQGADTLDALERDVAVSNNSWGPTDGTGQLIAFGNQAAWEDSITAGTQGTATESANREGLGTVYLWAAGNGHVVYDDNGNGYSPIDNANYDGAANYWRVLAISAVNARGRPAIYSERGANILVAGPGGRFCTDSELAVTTTFPDGFDRPDNWTRDYTDRPAYTRCFNGTSAAAPGVAGVAALVLDANPDLSWREVRWILATTARDDFQAADADPLDSADDWATNNAGETVSHAFGHGLVDAGAAVAEAEAWAQQGRSLGTLQEESKTDADFPAIAAASSVEDSVTVSDSKIETIEAVEVTLKGWSHDNWNRLDIELVHEDGSGHVTRSLLAEDHFCQDSTGSYSKTGCPALSSQDWTFSTTHHLGEAADGTWRLEITNNSAEEGSLDSWTLTFHGH